MRIAPVATALALAGVAAAQNMTVQVGATASAQGGIFQFIPPSFNATNGSVITFEFSGAPGNHSVTQSSFSDPCDRISGGFDSGFIFIPPTLSGPPPTFNLTITNDAKPIWFFCKQLVPAPHCKAGMVGAINAPASGSNTFAAYQNNAKAFSGTPDQTEGSLDGQGANGSPPGPFSGSVTGFSVPTGTAPVSASASAAASSSGSAAAPSGSSSGARKVSASLLAVVGAALGVAFA